jgi:pimeloyl-ACP methyl ester carboxylesterase
VPEQRVNGVKLFYELTGSGDPLVLVHGSWVDHNHWQFVVPDLTRSFRVLTYDRRGHSLSERPLGQGSRREDEEDLAALMEALDLAPAHVAANSFGASIALGLAARRPDLFRSLIVHEPPLMGIVADDAELRPLMMEFQRRLESGAEQLRAGDIEGGTRRFVEEVALGPGMWEQLPEEIRQTFVNNAPTYLDELQVPKWADLDVGARSGFSSPALLTEGDQSPPWFPKIMSKLAGAIDEVERLTFTGAGHVPHQTHPDDYVRAVGEFIRAHGTACRSRLLGDRRE